jgi:hypothetical protein
MTDLPQPRYRHAAQNHFAQGIQGRFVPSLRAPNRFDRPRTFRGPMRQPRNRPRTLERNRLRVMGAPNRLKLRSSPHVPGGKRKRPHNQLRRLRTNQYRHKLKTYLSKADRHKTYRPRAGRHKTYRPSTDRPKIFRSLRRLLLDLSLRLRISGFLFPNRPVCSQDSWQVSKASGTA